MLCGRHISLARTPVGAKCPANTVGSTARLSLACEFAECSAGTLSGRTAGAGFKKELMYTLYLAEVQYPQMTTLRVESA